MSTEREDIGERDGPAFHSLYFIGKKDDIIQAKRVTKSINGRDILVLYYGGVFHAIDRWCYHAGGPLQNGDIEEFDGRACILCPWHKYRITLLEGEVLYQATDPSQKGVKPTYTSKGVKQRVHMIRETNGDVFVMLNNFPGFINSDYYQTKCKGSFWKVYENR